MMEKKNVSEIKGYEDYNEFEICSNGNLISYKRDEPKILKGYDDGKGYLKVDLHYKEKRGVRIHRLVALAFVPNPDNKPQVNHIDGRKHNNDMSNLEWVTNSENQLHANRLGLINHEFDHSKEFTNIFQYSLDNELIEQHNSIGSACIKVFGEYNLTKVAGIRNCCKGIRPTAYGYKWRYK